MDDRIEWHCRLHYFVKCPRSCDIGHDTELELGVKVGEICEDLLRFGLTSNNSSNRHIPSEKKLKNVGAHKAIGSSEENSTHHDWMSFLLEGCGSFGLYWSRRVLY